MKRIYGIVLVSVGLLVLFAACDAEDPALDQGFVLSDGSGVWFDNPLDQSTIMLPAHVSVVVHGNVPSGISGFEYWLDGNSLGAYPTTGSDNGAPFAQGGIPWVPSSGGWHTLKVAVLSMSGQPAAFTEITVFLDDGSDEQEQEEIQPEVEPSPTPTPQEVYSRCDLFEELSPTLTLFDILPGSTELTVYVNFGSLPGLEQPVEGDDDPWEYSAFLGNTEANSCRYEGYAGRLYCYFTLSERDLDTVQPMQVFVNLCDGPVFTHENVSILAPLCDRGMDRADCEATGGTWYCDRPDYNCRCICP